MAGLSTGGGGISGGAAGNADSGGNTGVTIGGFNAPQQRDKNMPLYVAGAGLLALLYILKKK